MGVRYFCDLCQAEHSEDHTPVFIVKTHLTFIGDVYLCGLCEKRLQKHLTRMWNNLKEK